MVERDTYKQMIVIKFYNILLETERGCFSKKEEEYLILIWMEGAGFLGD